MVEILSQSEIEALLASLTGEDGGTGADAGSSGDSGHGLGVLPEIRSARAENHALIYELYDFRRPDKFSKDQMRTLQMLHETFARSFASSLSAYLTVATHIDLISVEQIPYDEYNRTLTNSLINVFSMAPLAGQAILEIEFSVALSMIDRLLGGPGNMVKNSNVLTEIEQSLTDSIVARALNDLKHAWEGVARFQPIHESTEMQAQFVQIAPPNDVVVAMLFEVKVGDLRGAMSICIPYVLLKPISAKFSAHRWFSSGKKTGFSPAAPMLVQRLETTAIDCMCRLGVAPLTVRELLDLSVGDTITLQRKATDEVDLVIGDVLKFKGRPAKSGRKLAMHINRPATPADAAMTGGRG